MRGGGGQGVERARTPQGSARADPPTPPHRARARPICHLTAPLPSPFLTWGSPHPPRVASGSPSQLPDPEPGMVGGVGRGEGRGGEGEGAGPGERWETRERGPHGGERRGPSTNRERAARAAPAGSRPECDLVMEATDPAPAIHRRAGWRGAVPAPEVKPFSRAMRGGQSVARGAALFFGALPRIGGPLPWPRSRPRGTGLRHPPLPPNGRQTICPTPWWGGQGGARVGTPSNRRPRTEGGRKGGDRRGGRRAPMAPSQLSLIANKKRSDAPCRERSRAPPGQVGDVRP